MVCDDLIQRLVHLTTAAPRLNVLSHTTTAQLAKTPSPVDNRDYKHREDLVDAIIAAWTAALWSREGFQHCQVLGEPDPPHPTATIIAPCRAEQRLRSLARPPWRN